MVEIGCPNGKRQLSTPCVGGREVHFTFFVLMLLRLIFGTQDRIC